MESLPRIVISMGDPAGVGPEIIAKAFAEPQIRPYHATVVGDASIMQQALERWAPRLTIHRVDSTQDEVQSDALNLIDLNNVSSLPTGPSREGGSASVEYIQVAVREAMERRADAIVTAPISKESIHLAGHFYPGHTELLAHLTGTPRTALMLTGRRLRVVLATTHAPLSQVSQILTQETLVETLRMTHHWLSCFVTDTPRIAVLGLNPHCGDGGIFGDEEARVIVPAMEQARSMGIPSEGPFPADAFFSRNPECDAVIAMYHDQGMVPIKMEAQGQAVNITLGLPIIRTSVDHGTAFDIAWKGTASAQSMQHVMRSASKLASAQALSKQ
ncbi:MAG: 4-hydroxythreonine-4-phosphate dehydrogenase PdxA [Candidatus Nitrohelix vancouverensis]|uniref:4-hydroxythreonine-4-phosphate dehydrogenase PdxA n=1 Tax=Candidatus Nitrohelix vancouverensis TaxID=2705534 RepID=A0A7T0C260_9BACT|nr:MAG: 4-hydroxythreonine-4-phosphate dehydrogenase PdxA [Candidatus Nitrohelix vancouverensis]